MDFHKQQPIYLQIADVLLEDILQRKISDGERVPSVRELALSVQVNPNTVQRSYQWLQDEEIIIQKRGIGFFLCDKVYEKTLHINRDELIKFTIPETIKQMKLLGIGIHEFEEIFQSMHN